MSEEVKMDVVEADPPFEEMTAKQRKKARQKAKKKAAAANGDSNNNTTEDNNNNSNNNNSNNNGDGDDNDNDNNEAGSKKKKNKKKKKKAKLGAPIFEQFGGDKTKYPVGYLYKHGSGENPTHDWRKVYTDKERDEIRENAKKNDNGAYSLLKRHGRSDEELEKYDNELLEEKVYDLRRAAEAHRQIRAFMRPKINPGASMYEIAQELEEASRMMTSGPDVTAPLGHGVGFPTGLSRNHIAAHDTALGPNDTRTLSKKDIVKVDFGVHVNGWIVDSAFTMAWEDKFDPLLEAVKEATYAGIAAAGVDVPLGDIGDAVQEVLDASEVSIDGEELKPVKPIANLSGHSIGPYKIHTGKSVPIIRDLNYTREERHADPDPSRRMEEGELFAVEIFGTTGSGECGECGESSHFMLDMNAPRVPLRLPSAKKLLGVIQKERSSLPFSQRDLLRVTDPNKLKIGGALRCLVDAGLVEAYPPLCDVKGSYTAQFEHTLIIRPTCKEVLSKGDDY